MLNNRYVRNFTRLFCLVLLFCIIFSSCALDENEEHDTYEGTLENVSEGKNDQEITNDVDYSKLYFTKLDSTEEIAITSEEHFDNLVLEFTVTPPGDRPQLMSSQRQLYLKIYYDKAAEEDNWFVVGSTLDCSLHDRGEENGLNYMTVIVTEPFDTEGIKELTKDKYIEKILVSCKFLYTEYDVEDGVLSNYEKLGFVDIPIVESEAQFDEIWAEKMSYEEGRIVSIKVKVNILLDDKSEGFDEAMAAIEAATLLYVSDRYAPLITCYLPSPYNTEQLKALAKLDAVTAIRLDVRIDYPTDETE